MAGRAPNLPLFALLSWIIAAPVGAEPWAFVSVSEPSNRAVRVVNLATMSVETSITGLGDEPGRMVANADRTRIYVSSASISGGVTGQVHVIDTPTRQRIATATVGNAQNRTIALSPDGLRVYTLKRQVSGSSVTLGVVALDAFTLAEITTAPLVGGNCTTNLGDVFVMPDGRILYAGCTDALRVIDPATFSVTSLSSVSIGSSRLLGASPDGNEVYASQPVQGGPATFGSTGVRAINPTTGVINPVTWNLPPASSYPGFGNASVVRMVLVGSGPDAVYYFTYFDPGFSNAPIVWATPASLASRQFIGLAAVGSTAVVGAAPSGAVGLASRTGSARRVAFSAPNGLTPPPVATTSDFLSLPGVGTLTDIIVVPYPPEPMFVDGFEDDEPPTPVATRISHD